MLCEQGKGQSTLPAHTSVDFVFSWMAGFMCGWIVCSAGWLELLWVWKAYVCIVVALWRASNFFSC